MICPGCNREYPIVNGIPNMIIGEWLQIWLILNSLFNVFGEYILKNVNFSCSI